MNHTGESQCSWTSKETAGICWGEIRGDKVIEDKAQRHRGKEEFAKTIVLVRHGRSIAPMATFIRGHELGGWVADFNQAGIAGTLMPPAKVQEIVTSAGCVLASDLRRSLESASLLAPSRQILIDPDLGEAELPSSIGVALPLPVGMWIVIARVAWWLNWVPSRESIAMTRARAERVTRRLCELADQHKAVAVIGHGMFNRFIAAELSERGWRGPKFLPSGHWTAARFTRRADG